jgi:DNA modification methylase
MKCIDQHDGDGFTVYHGDCVDVLSALPDGSIGYSIFSPPFASLYTYSDDLRDMGNVRDHEEFGRQFAYLCEQLFRVIAPGRLVSIHCMNLPASKVRDGYIGIHDFRGHIIRAMQAAGFVYHSEVTIWKDPVTAMQRTKALGLLYKQVRKDAARSRQGLPDYLLQFGRPPEGEPGSLVTFRKDGENAEPVTHDEDRWPVTLWQRYASPVWMDIDQSDTLNGWRDARDHDDERHVCPLQLGVIRRALDLWTNPGDVVLSPFTGIGSEGVAALGMGRRFVGAELKPSYFRQAVANLSGVAAQPVLFGGEE